MNREKVFELLNDLDEVYIAESFSYTPEAAASFSERNRSMKTKHILTLALAAVLIIALGITAYAVFFSMSTRVPEPEETFRIRWDDNPGGYLEWSNAKLVVTFPDVDESRQIEFNPGWLPDEMSSLNTGEFRSRLTAERLAFLDGPEAVPAYQDMSQPLLIESYPMCMFNDGGALLLLYHEPGEITEDHWDELGVDVMYFHATQYFDAVPEFDRPAFTLEQNILLMSDPEAGWIIRVCGEIDMEQLLQVARNLQIRETGNISYPEDFDSHFAFFDGGVG